MLLPLPQLVASALPSIRWPLVLSESTVHQYLHKHLAPMSYEPLDTLSERRRRQKNGRAESDDDGSAYSCIDELVANVPAAISLLLRGDSSPNSESASHFAGDDEQRRRGHAIVSVALLLLGNGYADEAHDLITPLSWPDETHFGYGPSVYSTSSPDVVAEASYAHSLVHRREGQHVGEYGMVGYSNANYWANAAVRSRAVDSLPWGRVRSVILEASKGNAAAEEWCRERVVEEGKSVGDDDYWEPRALHELCAQVSRSGGRSAVGGGRGGRGRVGAEDDDDNDDDDMKKFAELACELELRVLLEHCLRGAGYDPAECVPVGKMEGVSGKQDAAANDARSPSATLAGTIIPTLRIENESIALVAANRMSSAHLDAFRRNGRVTVRNVLQPASGRGNGSDAKSHGRDEVVDVAERAVAAAGLVVRAMEVPACRLIRTAKLDGVEEREEKERKGEVGDVPFSGQKVVSVLIPIRTTTEGDGMTYGANAIGGMAGGGGGGSLSPGDASIVAGAVTGKERDGLWTFVACNGADDASATFVDRLYGTRGETPTTVIQWSKGTIHHNGGF